MSVKTITPQGLWQVMQAGPAAGRTVDLIDVRTPAEYESVHASCAKLVPLDGLDPKAVWTARSASNGQPLYIICKSGGRSAKACEKFQAAGFDNVISVDGGTGAWEQAGLPVVRGRWTLPLDRQIQSVAGSIALGGVLLGTFLNPWWYILPGCVGFGLTMAGLTGFCPMGILLARMPWNQGKQGGCCGTAKGASCR